MNRVITLSIALFVAILAMSVANTALACKLFGHRGHHHGCHQTVQHHGGGCGHSQGGCGHHGGCGHQSGCGHHGGCGHQGGGYGSGCEGGGTVIEQGPTNGGGDVPEAPSVQQQAPPKETSIRSNRFFRTASFRR